MPLDRSGDRLTGDYVLPGLPRGRYRLDAARLVIEDPFGLERVERRLDAGGAMVVYPRVHDLDRLFSDGGAPGGTGRRLLLSRTSGYDLHSVREYQHGESLRRVDWKSTAKRGKLMVRELEDSPRDEACVVLDCEGGLERRHRAGLVVRDAGARRRVGPAPPRSGRTPQRPGDDDGAHGEDAAGLAGGRLARRARPAGRRPRRRPPLAGLGARGRARGPRRVPPLRRHREPQPAARRQAHCHAVRAHRHRRGLGRRAQLGPQGAEARCARRRRACAWPAPASRSPACGAATTCAGRSPRAASTATSPSTGPSRRGRRHEGALAPRRRRAARTAPARPGDRRRHRARPRALRDLRDLHALARAHPAAAGAGAARAARLGRARAAAGADRRALDAPAAGGPSRCSWCRCC